MNYISELAYASHIAQANKSAKDRKQKNKYQQSVLLANDFINNVNESTSVQMTHLNTNNWQGEDRREGNDRRETSLNRGRYLESRLSKDRRYGDELYVKI